MKLILVNLSKRINKYSVASVIVFTLIISILSVYYGEFGYKDYLFKIEKETISNFYILETNEIITIVGTLFVSLLAFLEIIGNSEAYDSYFIARVGRFKYYFGKLISYLLVIFFVFLSVYSITTTIYLFRFKSVMCLDFVLKLYLYNNIYFIIMFILSFILVMISKNIFIPMLSFVLFWLTRILEDVEEIKYLLPTINYDIITKEVMFKTDFYYHYAYLLMMLIISYVIYMKKDVKC